MTAGPTESRSLAQSVEPIDRILAAAVRNGDVPGAIALVRHRRDIVFFEAYGAAALTPAFRPMGRDTIFDLASLTKPLATATLTLALVDRGTLDLDRPAAIWLPELTGTSYDTVTLRQLLAHTSGRSGWYPTYAATRDRSRVPEVISALEPSSPPGTHVEYTCLGYILLGFVLERAAGRPLNDLAADLIFRPLGLTSTSYLPTSHESNYASTECGNDYEKTMVAERGLTFDGWRDGFYPGVVNDGNAHYALRGVSGNAGLFGPASEVAILGQMWLNGGDYAGTRIISQELVTEATTDATPGLNEARGLGWQINLSRPGFAGPTSSGRFLSRRAYGHTGFTGTSLWIDPDRDLVAVLLTNRTHPSAGTADAINSLRARFHDAVATTFPHAGRIGTT